MNKGTLLRWVKKEGDYIKEQEVIFEVETDKTVMEVEAQISGFLRKILVTEGKEVPVALPIGIIGDKDEDINKMIDEAHQKLGKAEMIKEEPKTAKRVSQGIKEKQKIEPKKEKEEFNKISPRARRKAKELGIEVQLLEGSGPEGLVIEKDVVSYYQKNKIKVSSVAKKTGVEEVERIEKRISYTGMRKIIGDRLSISKFSAPHIYFTTSVDMSKAKELLFRLNQEIKGKISINDVVIFVVAKALCEQSKINCSLINEEIVYHKDVNIGVVAALEEGLIVPVVKNADKKSLLVLSERRRRPASTSSAPRRRPATPRPWSRPRGTRRRCRSSRAGSDRERHLRRCRRRPWNRRPTNCAGPRTRHRSPGSRHRR